MALIKDKILHSKEELTEKDFEYLKLDRNLGDLILNGFKEVIEENGDYDWLINGPYETLGFTSSIGSKIRKASEVEPQARKIASAFYKHGLRKGDVVHLAIPNSTENHCIAIGAWLCEAIVSLGDPGLSVNVLKTQLKETNAKMIVCFEGSREVIFNAIKEMNLLGKVVVVVMPLACPEMGQDLPITEEGFQFFQDFISDKDAPHPPKLADGKVDPDAVVVIFWSSGTTGVPKGVQHQLKYIQHFMKAMKDLKAWQSAKSKVLQTTCYFHVGGFIMPFEGMLKPSGFIFNHGQDIDDNAELTACDILYKEIDHFKPLTIICGSHHLVLLSFNPPSDKSLDLSSVTVVAPMGSTVPHSLYDKLKPCFPKLMFVHLGYGMTEIGTTVARSTDPRALGEISKDVLVKLVDPETGTLCGPNEVGEIMVKVLRGNVTKGYLNRPEENKKFFADDGYVHTGDLGHYDSNGLLYFEGRLKELIKYKNCHMYPMEIENVINSHPGVAESAVFGKPDPTVQELVTAAVVKVEGAKVTEDDIANLVSMNVDDAKKLRGGVIFVDKLPKNPQGKILRRKLLELCQ